MFECNRFYGVVLQISMLFYRELLIYRFIIVQRFMTLEIIVDFCTRFIEVMYLRLIYIFHEYLDKKPILFSIYLSISFFFQLLIL